MEISTTQYLFISLRQIKYITFKENISFIFKKDTISLWGENELKFGFGYE